MRFLQYLGLGICAILLTVFLGIGRGVVAFGFAVPSGIAPPLTPTIAQTSPDTTIEQGRQSYREGLYAEAIALWQQSLSTLTASNDTLNRAMVLSNLALAYRQLGQWDQANAAIQNSLDILNQFETLTAEGLQVLAQALNTQGSLQLAQGQSDEALANWEQATDVYQQAGDSVGEARSLINQAIALRILGFHLRALQQLEQVNDQLDTQTNSEIRVTLLRSLGETQRLTGDLEQSQQNLQEGLQLATQLNAPDQIVATHISLGNTLWVQAQQKEALAERTKSATTQAEANQLFQAALAQYQQAVEQSPSPLTQIQAQLNQLDILIHQQVWSEAHTLWAALPDSLPTLPLSRASIEAAIKLAESGMELRERSPCSTYACPSDSQLQQILVTAIQQAQDLQDSQTEAYARGSLGHLYEQQAQLPRSLELTQQALSLAQLNQAESAYRWQWQLGRLYKAQGDTEQAIAAYDAAFRTVQDLRNDLLFLNSDIQFTFRNRIEPLYREYVNLLLPPNIDGTEGNQQAQTVQAEIAKEVVDDLRLAELENFLACSLVTAQGSGELATIDELADADQHTAILYPIILGDRLEVLLKRPNQPLLRYPSQPVAQATLTQTLDQLRKFLERPYFSSKRGKTAAAQVYQWLIQPAEQQNWLNPEATETLVFVLDGEFRNIPMAALYDTNAQQYLVEKYAIAITFGDLELPKAPPSNRFRALIGGLSDATNTSGFGALTYVPIEISTIEQTLERTKVLENNQFTKATLESEIRTSPYTIVHLATHGEFGFTREETFLLAATQQQSYTPEADESTLTVEKIDLNQLNALLKERNQTPIELLVLSACETATGDDREVLGIAGMAIQAGARSTLATLWSIDDSATSLLMKAFYDGLVHQQLSKAQALRYAQQQLIHTPGYKPSDWAPYLLVGDWR